MGKNNKEIFSENLRYYMNLRIKSRKDISMATGIPYGSIRDYEKGYCYAKPDKIEKIANYLEISPLKLTKEHIKDDIMDIVDNSEDSKMILDIKNIIDNSEDKKLILDIMIKLSKLSKEDKKHIMRTLDYISNEK